MGLLGARVVAVAALAVGLLASVDNAATAHVEIDDYVVLPQTGHGDVVRLPGTTVLAIAGGDESPVSLVDVAETTVRTVPGTEGVRTLDLDADGSHLHGVSATPDEIVEIDASSGEVSRRWPVALQCSPSDVVMRGGALWMVDPCRPGLRRLDPASGSLSTESNLGFSLVGVPGSPRFYALAPSADALLELEATPSGLIELDRADSQGFQTDLRLSDDGSTLLARYEGYSWNSTGFWDTTDLGFNDSWDSPLHPTWSDGVHVGVGLQVEGTAGLMTQADQSVVNTFLPAGPVDSLRTADVRLVDDVLAVTGWVGQEKRLYVALNPLLEEPRLTLEVPWGATGVDTPTPVQGTMQRDGAPVAGQELQLLQVSPTHRDLGTVVTDAQGHWTAEWRPDQAGSAVLEVRYRGERDSVARERVPVHQDYYRLDVTAPTEVNGGDPFDVVFRATHNGRPMAGVDVLVTRWQVANSTLQDPATTHVTDAQGEIVVGGTAGAVDSYTYRGRFTSPAGYSPEAYHQVAVRRTPTILTSQDPPRFTVPGDNVPLSVTLTTADGRPLAGQPVLIGIQRESDPRRWLTVTTDEAGRASTVETSEQEGFYSVQYRWDGTSEYDDAWADSDIFDRTRIPTTTTVDGEATGEVGVPTTLHGAVSPVEGPVEVTLTNLDTSAVTTTTTDDAGNWFAEVTPSLPGPNRWRARFEGTLRLAPSLAFFDLTTPRAASAIESLSVTNARYGQMYRLTGKLVGPDRSSQVRISWDGDVPTTVTTAADGTFALEKMTPGEPGPHVVTVAFPGDSRYQPTQQELTVEVLKGTQWLLLEAPTRVPAGGSFVVDGRLVPSTTSATQLTVTGPDGSVTRVPIRQDEPSLRFQLTAPRTAGDQATWTARIPPTAYREAGSATFSAFVTKPHDVEFTGQGAPYEVGEDASVLIRVPGSSSPEATVEVVDGAGNDLWSWTGTIPLEGLTYPTTLHDAQRVRVTVLEDAEHHTTTATYFFRLTPRLSTRLTGRFDRVGRYAVYGIRHDPEVATLQEPYFRRYADRCLRHIFQKLTPRGWEVVRYPCAEADEPRLVSTMDWRRPAGARYRVAHRFYGDNWYRSTQGTWHYFRFR